MCADYQSITLFPLKVFEKMQHGRLLPGVKHQTEEERCGFSLGLGPDFHLSQRVHQSTLHVFEMFCGSMGCCDHLNSLHLQWEPCLAISCWMRALDSTMVMSCLNFGLWFSWTGYQGQLRSAGCCVWRLEGDVFGFFTITRMPPALTGTICSCVWSSWYAN